jgi:hypothetical protein
MSLPIKFEDVIYESGDVFNHLKTKQSMVLSSVDNLYNVYLKDKNGELKFRFNLPDFIKELKNGHIELVGFKPTIVNSSTCFHVWKKDRFFSKKLFITCSKCGKCKN